MSSSDSEEEQPIPPTRATFVAEWKSSPGHDSQTGIDDLAWNAYGQLLVAQCTPRQVTKLSISTKEKTIAEEKIVENFSASSVSTAFDGSWAVCSYKENIIKLHLKEDKDDEVEKVKEWKPHKLEEPCRVDITLKKIYVLPFGKGPLYVYGRDRKLKSDGWCASCDMWDIHATDDKVIIATCLTRNHFHIMNMKKDTLVTVRGDGKVLNVREDVSSSDSENENPVDTGEPSAFSGGKLKNGLAGVCTTPSNHIFICDYINRRVCVYSMQGTYLYNLDLDLGEKAEPWAIDVLPVEGDNPLLAVGVKSESKLAAVRIYTLH